MLDKLYNFRERSLLNNNQKVRMEKSAIGVTEGIDCWNREKRN